MKKVIHEPYFAAACNQEKTWLHIGSLAIGIVLVCLTLSAGYIFGTGPYWQQPQGDAAQGQIGWLYYAHDLWRFPIFNIDNYHMPEGSNLLLSDSLPLFGLPAKLLYQTTGWLLIYTGVWVALCFLLQAIAASRLLRALDVREPLSHLAGVLLLCYTPALFLRFGQASLLGQFFILLSLEGYVRAKRYGLTNRGWLGFCALPIIALLVHPYLAALSSVVVLVTLLDQWREQRMTGSLLLLRLGSFAAAGLSVMAISGFLIGVRSNFGDYGIYSLNLLSPFVPFADTLSGSWFGTNTPTIPTLYQWEGGCYLGAGMLALALLAFPALRDWRGGLQRHALLIVALLALLLFAISNRVGIGSHEILHFPLPH